MPFMPCNVRPRHKSNSRTDKNGLERQVFGRHLLDSDRKTEKTATKHGGKKDGNDHIDHLTASPRIVTRPLRPWWA